MPRVPSIDTITVAGLPPLTLTRQVSPGLARKLTDNYARIDALNKAHKTLDDAAGAMGMCKTALITWLKALGIKWHNKKTYNIV